MARPCSSMIPQPEQRWRNIQSLLYGQPFGAVLTYTLPSLLRRRPHLGATLLFRWSLPFGFATSSSATSKGSEEGSCPGKHDTYCQRYTTRWRMQPTPFETVYHTPAMLASLLEAQVCEHAGHHVSSEYRDVQRVHVPISVTRRCAFCCCRAWSWLVA